MIISFSSLNNYKYVASVWYYFCLFTRLLTFQQNDLFSVQKYFFGKYFPVLRRIVNVAEGEIVYGKNNLFNHHFIII